MSICHCWKDTSKSLWHAFNHDQISKRILCHSFSFIPYSSKIILFLYCHKFQTMKLQPIAHHMFGFVPCKSWEFCWKWSIAIKGETHWIPNNLYHLHQIACATLHENSTWKISSFVRLHRATSLSRSWICFLWNLIFVGNLLCNILWIINEILFQFLICHNDLNTSTLLDPIFKLCKVR